jgi:ribosomal 30S subunit maturation factor RimM
VRYGKIKVENKKQKKYQISISDKNLYEEVINSQNVVLAIENRELEKIEDLLGYFDPVGMKVIWNDIEVATIKGYFSNGAHDVYELQLENGKEILIPDVEAFVIETNIKKRYIKVVDLDQFIYD